MEILSSLPVIHNLRHIWHVAYPYEDRHYLGVTYPLHVPTDTNYKDLPTKVQRERGIYDLSIFGRNMLPEQLEDFMGRLIINIGVFFEGRPRDNLYRAIIQTITQDLDIFRTPWFRNIIMQVDGSMWKDIALQMNFRYVDQPLFLKNNLYLQMWDILGISLIDKNVISVNLFCRATELNKFKDVGRGINITRRYKYLPLFDPSDVGTIEYAGKIRLKEHDLLTYGRLKNLLGKEETSLLIHPLITSSLEEPQGSVQIVQRVIVMLNFTVKLIIHPIKTALLRALDPQPPVKLNRALQLYYLHKNDIRGLFKAMNIKNKLPLLAPVKFKNYSRQDVINELTKASQGLEYNQNMILDIDRWNVWNRKSQPLLQNLIKENADIQYI